MLPATDPPAQPSPKCRRTYGEHCLRVTLEHRSGHSESESLIASEYRVGHRTVSCQFDRQYRRSLMAGPSHLALHSALVQLQELICLGISNELGFDHMSEGAARLTTHLREVRCRYPQLVRSHRALSHEVDIGELSALSATQWTVKTTSRIESLVIEAVSDVYLHAAPKSLGTLRESAVR